MEPTRISSADRQKELRTSLDRIVDDYVFQTRWGSHSVRRSVDAGVAARPFGRALESRTKSAASRIASVADVYTAAVRAILDATETEISDLRTAIARHSAPLEELEQEESTSRHGPRGPHRWQAAGLTTLLGAAPLIGLVAPGTTSGLPAWTIAPTTTVGIAVGSITGGFAGHLAGARTRRGVAHALLLLIAGPAVAALWAHIAGAGPLQTAGALAASALAALISATPWFGERAHRKRRKSDPERQAIEHDLQTACMSLDRLLDEQPPDGLRAELAAASQLRRHASERLAAAEAHARASFELAHAQAERDEQPKSFA